MSYSDLLKDPRWQRKRLEIMHRDGFACVKCHDATTTLNVHHDHYVYGVAPWDYPDGSLQTLCRPCHLIEHPGAVVVPPPRMRLLATQYVELQSALRALRLTMVEH